MLISAVAGLLAVNMAKAADQPAAGEGERVHCYGINKCKGAGDCSGKGQQCARHKTYADKGHINLPKDVCLRIKGAHTPLTNPWKAG